MAAKVLAWRLSNTMEADFRVAAPEDAIARYGTPDIFNTDHGSQFSFPVATTLKDAGIRISMDDCRPAGWPITITSCRINPSLAGHPNAVHATPEMTEKPAT